MRAIHFPVNFAHSEGESRATTCLVTAHNRMISSLFKSSDCICEQRRSYEEVAEALIIVLREYYSLREACKDYGIGVAE